MKSIFTKKVLVIVSVVAFVALSAIVIAFSTGNINYPGLSNPDEVFYQRIDEQGNVVYSITNEELFEEIKGNDGIQQLLFLTDSFLLDDYFTDILDDDVADKLLELTYGTSDADLLADLTDDQRDGYIDAFAQTMTLAGFNGIEEDYAKLIIARERYVLEYADEEGIITENVVISEYLDSYFEDISAIKIRFTSEADAEFVMQKYNLVTFNSDELRLYNGYVFADEALLNGDSELIEAYEPLGIYYFNDDSDIVDIEGEVIYTSGVQGVYTDADDLEYRIDSMTGDLLDNLLNVVVDADLIFDDLFDAEVYEAANTEYYTVTRTDAYDKDETINVYDSNNAIAFTIDPDGHIWNTLGVDVTHTTDLVVNKVYTEIEDVVTISEENSTELSETEILAKYIEMYNYVYGNYRTALAEDATAADLITLDNEYLDFNYEALSDSNATVAQYLFSTLSIADEAGYSVSPKALISGSSTYYYMAYKLNEATKIDVTSPIFDYLEPLIVIPTTIGASIDLPKTTYYDGTIAWSSSDPDIISSAGLVVAPETDEEVELTFTISVFGETKSFTIDVTVLADGDTVEVTEPEWTEVSLKTILNNNTIYDLLYDRLLNDYVYGTSGSDNVESALVDTRTDLGFVIYDRFLGLDYQTTDTEFELSSKGDKEMICSFEKTLTSDSPYEVTADDLFTYALSRNIALYTLYAAQDSELLYSTYFVDIFGEQTNLKKNKTDKMEEMYTAIDNSKSEYVYYESLYASMGSSFGYDSYIDYAYARYGVKTEMALLQYFVSSELQPHLIQETSELYDVVEALYPSVEDYFDNYFSLNVSQLLIHIDFDEDGSPDDFDDFKDSMTPAEIDTYNGLLFDLETAIADYPGTYAELVEEYNDAARDDETWGEFKQNGYFILTEDLNAVDDDDVSHSLTYSGTYGIKDTFVGEFVDELVALYQEYQLPQNLDKETLESGLVSTVFGLHLIEVGQGDDFDKPSCEFEEADSDNPEYSSDLLNDEEMPTLEQLQLFALYKYYSMVYDLSDADIESRYEITIPSIPSSVNTALIAYFDDLLSGTYVLGTINIRVAERLADGEFLPTSYTTPTNAELLVMLDDVRDVYFEAIFGDYITE